MEEQSKLDKVMTRAFRTKILADHFEEQNSAARKEAAELLRAAGITMKVGDKKRPFDEGEIAGVDALDHRVKQRVLKAMLDEGKITFAQLMDCCQVSTTKLVKLCGQNVIETKRTPGVGFKFFANKVAKDAVEPAVKMMEAALGIAAPKPAEEPAETKAA